jgi:hypothetical protein
MVMTVSASDKIPVGLECGVNMEHPVIAMFSNYHNPLYQAKVWGKNPSDQVFGIKPHKRIRHLALVPESVVKGEYSDLVLAVYNSDNKIPTPWGCWNRYMNTSYKVKDGFDDRGIMKFKTIDHVLSRDCKHTKDFPNDSACIDCVNRV